jgi:hypothetical protein
MEDIEIYNMAGQILSDITQDLNEGIYSKLKGSLSLAWSEEPNFNAWAEAKSNIGCPPQHKIGLNYELVRQVYRDVESFCEFSYFELGKEETQQFFAHLNPEPPLPEMFTKKQCCINMFIGAITFVYFHELAHLMQEHGYIRRKFGGIDDKINEFNLNAQSPLTGKAAAISHVTELAADFNAVSRCIYELLRQFDGEKDELKGAIYLFVCGLSCIFHKFNNDTSLFSPKEPIGSHPNPLSRMEVNLPHIYELLDLIAEISEHGLSRIELVHLCHRASDSSALFEMWHRDPKEVRQTSPFLKGVLNKPEDKDYFRVIVSTWDEIESSIIEVEHLGHEFDRLSFSNTLRDYLGFIKKS